MDNTCTRYQCHELPTRVILAKDSGNKEPTKTPWCLKHAGEELARLTRWGVEFTVRHPLFNELEEEGGDTMPTEHKPLCNAGGCRMPPEFKVEIHVSLNYCKAHTLEAFHDWLEVDRSAHSEPIFFADEIKKGDD